MIQVYTDFRGIVATKNNLLLAENSMNEINEYLKKTIDKRELAEKISIKTRQYAKRQSTWARGHMKDWNKVDPAGLETVSYTHLTLPTKA